MLLGTWTTAQGFPRKADSAMRFVRAVAILVWSMWHELFYVIRADASGVHADTLWKTSSLNIDAFRQSDKSLFSFFCLRLSKRGLQFDPELVGRKQNSNVTKWNSEYRSPERPHYIFIVKFFNSTTASVLFSCCAVEFSWKLSSWLKSSSVVPQVLPCLIWILWKF